MSESLDPIVRAIGGPPADAMALVFTRWDELVGAEAAAHSKPLSLRGGELAVAVTEPAWATQIRYIGARLAERANALLGEEVIRRVEVRVLR